MQLATDQSTKFTAKTIPAAADPSTPSVSSSADQRARANDIIDALAAKRAWEDSRRKAAAEAAALNNLPD